jgi:hypothetical protein
MTGNIQPSLRVRLAACAVFAAAPAVIALGTAASSYADAADTGGGSSSFVATPTHHEAFPGQNPQTDRLWYQTPRYDNKPESTNPLETPFGQFVLGSLGLGNLGPLGNLGLGNIGGLGGFR